MVEDKKVEEPVEEIIAEEVNEPKADAPPVVEEKPEPVEEEIVEEVKEEV